MQFFPVLKMTSRETLKHIIGISSIAMEVIDTNLEKEAIFCCDTTKSKDRKNTGVFNARLHS